MNISKLGRLFELKYSFLTIAADPNMKDVEAGIRNSLDALWAIPNISFNILRVCADSGAAKPTNADEQKAIIGFQFCRKIVGIIDYLKANKSTVKLSEIRRALETIVGDIKEVETKDQFSNLSELIYQLMPHGKKYDRKLREQQYAKARKGLSRITSIALTILNNMNNFGGAVEQEGRFAPEGAKLSEHEIMSFIRQHGDEYGVPDLATWSLVLDADPSLEQPITRMVHALSRGHNPRDSGAIKSIIHDIVAKHQEAKQTNLEQFAANMAYKYNWRI